MRDGARRETGPTARSRVRTLAPRVALVHDWLTGMRGGEKVLEAICGALSRRDDLHAAARPGLGVAGARAASRAAIVRPVAARGGAPLPQLPAAVPDRHRAVRLRSLRSRHQHQPLRGQVGGRAGTRAARLLLPLARCATRGTSSTSYFGPAQVGRLRSRLLRPVLARLARWDRDTADRVRPLCGEFSLCCGENPPIL